MVDQNDNPDDDLGSFEEAEYLSADRGDGTPQKQNFKEVWDKNPSLKIFAGIAGVAFLLITFMVFGSGSGDNPAEGDLSSVRKSGEVTQAPGTAELPPAYEEAVRESNKQNADSAAQTGASSLPTPIARPSERIEAPVQVEENDPLSEWRKEAETRRIERQKKEDSALVTLQPPALPTGPNGVAGGGIGGPNGAVSNEPQNPPLPLTPNAEQIAQMAQQLSQQMQSVLESQIPKESAVVSMNIQPGYDVTKYFPLPPENTGVNNNGGAQAPNSSVIAQKPLVSAGTIAYAQILTEANSDVPGPVLAEVASGPLSGGRAIGTFQVAEDHMVLQFTRIVKDGVEYPVQAFALDPATTLPGMASDVNKHYFTRIMIPAAASFISGFAEAATQTDKTTVVVDSTVVSDESDLDSREELLKGVNEAAQKASEVIDEDSDRPTTIRVFAGTRIGLLFISSVMDPAAVQQQSQFGNNAGTYGQVGQVGQAVFSATPYGQAYSAYQNYSSNQQQQRAAATASVTTPLPPLNGTPPKPLR